MILLVPISPEVPKARAPILWPALVMVLLVCIAFVEVYDTLVEDSSYVEALEGFVTAGDDGTPRLEEEANAYLKLRPLLSIAPAKGDWNLERVFFANFIHGSLVHLFLNLVGVFAGMRICATFIPFGCSVAIFLLCGSLGLLTSLLVSSEVSEYIPHVGASAGIFALMGTYYVYNFRYRTRYFFWFPSRRGFINLRTSWFFFLDVILLEIVLSTAQLFPDRLDSVDHIAHVVGFGSGVLLAFLLRFFQRWPSYIQSRGEYIYWSKIVRPRVFNAVLTPIEIWLELLELNAYNDQIKIKVCRSIYHHSEHVSDETLARVFGFLSPTFIRLHTREVGSMLRELLKRERALPRPWLMATPYDSIIRIAKVLANPPEIQHLLFRLISEYRRAHPEGGDVDRKLELLMNKLSGAMGEASGRPRDDRRGSATGASNRSSAGTR